MFYNYTSSKLMLCRPRGAAYQLRGYPIIQTEALPVGDWTWQAWHRKTWRRCEGPFGRLNIRVLLRAHNDWPRNCSATTEKREKVASSHSSLPTEAILPRRCVRTLQLHPRKIVRGMAEKGQRRSFADVRVTSAYTLRAAQKRTFPHFAFGPQADSCTAAINIAIRSPRRRPMSEFEGIADVLRKTCDVAVW